MTSVCVGVRDKWGSLVVLVVQVIKNINVDGSTHCVGCGDKQQRASVSVSAAVFFHELLL